MISAFGVDHGEISKANVKFGEYGFSSAEGRKRTIKDVKRDSRVSAGHGNAGRLAAHGSVGTGLGAGLGAASMIGTHTGGKGAAIGGAVGAGIGGLAGLAGGKGENLQRSAARNVGGAVKRGDIRRVQPGERTTAWRNRIVKD